MVGGRKPPRLQAGVVAWVDVGIGINRNAKPLLGIRVYRAKLGLGVPSRTDFTLNAS